MICEFVLGMYSQTNKKNHLKNSLGHIAPMMTIPSDHPTQLHNLRQSHQFILVSQQNHRSSKLFSFQFWSNQVGLRNQLREFCKHSQERLHHLIWWMVEPWQILQFFISENSLEYNFERYQSKFALFFFFSWFLEMEGKISKINSTLLQTGSPSVQSSRTRYFLLFVK